MAYRFGRPVRELQQQLSSAEFVELVAFEQIDPPAGEKAEWAIRQIAAGLFSSKSRRWRPDDFLRFPPELPPETYAAAWAAWFRSAHRG